MTAKTTKTTKTTMTAKTAMTAWHWLRLQCDGHDHGPLVQALGAGGLLAPGLQVWGVFAGLFGIGSNELVVMAADTVASPAGPGMPASGPVAVPAAPLDAGALAARGIRIVQAEVLRATVRPAAVAPLARPGLYVFRFFDVPAAHVDEVVALSAAAWTTFEHGADYQAEPQGLFAPWTGEGPMLLLTWYDGFGSWQASRAPHPDARASFDRRQRLTRGTVAFATRLLDWTRPA